MIHVADFACYALNKQGVWGTICDNNWNIEAARVVCKQLNIGIPISAPPSAMFGEGEGPIILNDVKVIVVKSCVICWKLQVVKTGGMFDLLKTDEHQLFVLDLPVSRRVWAECANPPFVG